MAPTCEISSVEGIIIGIQIPISILSRSFLRCYVKRSKFCRTEHRWKLGNFSKLDHLPAVWPDNFRELMKYEFGISIHGPTDPWQAANRWEAHFSSPARACLDACTRIRRKFLSVSREIITPRENSAKLPPRRRPLGNNDGICKSKLCISRMKSKRNESLIVLISFSAWRNSRSSNEVGKWI